MRGNLRATFEGWKLPDGRVLKGQYEILLRGTSYGIGYRYKAVLATTGVEFYDSQGKHLSFAELKLSEGKAQIAKMFDRQVTDWKPSR